MFEYNTPTFSKGSRMSLSLDRKKLKAMILKEPYKYVDPLLFANIFPKKVVRYDEKELQKKIDDYCENSSFQELEKIKDEKKRKEEERKILRNILFSLIPVEEIISEELTKTYQNAKAKYIQLSEKEQGTFMYDYGEKFRESFFANVKTKVFQALESKKLCKNFNVEQVVQDILYMGKSAVYEWQKKGVDKNGNDYEYKCISSPKKKIISEHFGYKIKIWDELNEDNINKIANKLYTYKEEDIFSNIDTLFGYENSEELFQSKEILYIHDPKDAYDYYVNALYFRQKGEYKKALDAIEQALKCDDMFVYRYYKELLHQKAILLSTDAIGEFQEALKVLKLLHYTMQYSQKVPEIITLMGSNYKRLALIDKNGSYKEELDEQDKNNLLSAIEFYQISYRYREEMNERERFYDLLNILYLSKMIAYLEGEEFFKEDFFTKYGRFNIKDYSVDKQNWWELISFIEYKILLCEISKDKIKEQLESYFNGDINKVNPDFITITLRQVKLYLTVVKNIDNEAAKNDCSISLFEFLIEYLKKV